MTLVVVVSDAEACREAGHRVGQIVATPSVASALLVAGWAEARAVRAAVGFRRKRGDETLSFDAGALVDDDAVAIYALRCGFGVFDPPLPPGVAPVIPPEADE